MIPIYFTLSLIFLYLSRTILNRSLSSSVHRTGGTRKTLIVLWSVIFIIGTVIHELSHFFFAILSGARTGKIEIFPRFINDHDETSDTRVTLGSVETQRLNPLQGFLIGLAPLFTGLGTLFWLSAVIPEAYQRQSYLSLIFSTYLFFTVSNSFFPSWSDIKQVIPLVLIIGISMILLLFSGQSIQALRPIYTSLLPLLGSASALFLLGACLNLAISLLLRLVPVRRLR